MSIVDPLRFDPFRRSALTILNEELVSQFETSEGESLTRVNDPRVWRVSIRYEIERGLWPLMIEIGSRSGFEEL